MAEKTSLVIKVSSPLVITSDGGVDIDILHQMLEAGLNAMSGDGDCVEWLRQLLGDDDVVGIKVNTLGGPGMSTRVPW